MKTLFFLFFLSLLFSFFFFSCEQAVSPTAPGKSQAKKAQTKKKNLRVQEECRKIGKGKCDKACVKICDDIFSDKDNEEDCEKLSKSLVKQFKTIIDNVEEGEETDDLDLPALKCMLDLEDDGFVSAVEEMSRREAKEFLYHISDDDSLAEVLYNEDDEFNIIEELLKTASRDSDLKDQLSVNIEDGKSFLWHSAEEKNEHAFNWLDSYVTYTCEEDSDNDCPNYDEIGALGAYCHYLTNLSDKDLKDFVSSADLFKDRYESAVQDQSYEYAITSHNYLHYVWNEEYNGDFKDFCKLETTITEGERRLRTSSVNGETHFDTATLKANLAPVTTTIDESNPKTDPVNQEWQRIVQGSGVALFNKAREKYGTGSKANIARLSEEEVNSALSGTQFGSGEHEWTHGNIYGTNKLKAVGDTFWFLDKDRNIITWVIDYKYKIYMKRGQVIAPSNSPDDPKTGKVRRATFMYYIPGISSTNPPEYPNCTVYFNVNAFGTLHERTRASAITCPYHYCLVDYELNSDNTVKTAEVIKCALGRP